MSTDTSATTAPESPIIEDAKSSNSTHEGEAREAQPGEWQAGRTNLRSSSSRIANLRAAFEGNVGTEVTPPKRRLQSVDSHGDHSREHDEVEKEVARMRSELDKEKELRIEFEERCTALEDELEEVQQRFEGQTAAIKAEWEQKYQELLHERENISLRLQQQELEAKTNKKDAEHYQLQVIDLKKSISQSTRIEGQVTDSTLSQEFQLLYHETQNWVVNNFRRSKCEAGSEELCQRLEKVVSPDDMEQLRPLYKDFDRSAKIAIYQSTVAVFMMKIFSTPLIFGLSPDLEWQTHLAQITTSLSDVLDSVAYNKWRSMTMDGIRHSPIVSGSVETKSQSIAESICTALGALTDFEQSEIQRTSLGALIKRTASLCHTFRVQRPQYEFKLPAVGSQFDLMSMEDIAEESDGVVEKGKAKKVLCATFPSVYKLGDELGDHMHLRNIIVKAKVLCKEA